MLVWQEDGKKIYFSYDIWSSFIYSDQKNWNIFLRSVEYHNVIRSHIYRLYVAIPFIYFLFVLRALFLFNSLKFFLFFLILFYFKQFFFLMRKPPEYNVCMPQIYIHKTQNEIEHVKGVSALLQVITVLTHTITVIK